MKAIWKVTLTLLVCCLNQGAQANELDNARERQLADLQRHHQNALNSEQVLTLSTDTETFLALRLQQRSANPQGGILILHDAGHTPDWPVHLQQARQFLPNVGWTTLAIALPGPENQQADQAEPTLDRIAAGVQQLNQEGLFNLVFLGYGEGAYWAARYMVERLNPLEEVGYALMMVNARDTHAALPAILQDLNRPTLDLILLRDSAYRHQARERQAVANRQRRDNFTQIKDPDIGSFYHGQQPNRVTRRLWGWLRTRAAGREETVNPI